PVKKGGKFADNIALSQARAETVKAYFVQKGIADDRLIAKGYGDSSPMVDIKDVKGAKLNAARAKNRRVEFKLVSGGGGGVSTGNTPAAAPTAPPAAPAKPTPAPAKPAPAPANPQNQPVTKPNK